MDNKEKVIKLWQEFDKQNYKESSEFFHEDLEVYWPTSFELFTSRKKYIDLNINFPGLWRFRLDRVEEINKNEFATILYVYSKDVEKSFYKTSFITFEGDKIKKMIEYWAWQDKQPEFRKEYTVEDASYKY